MIVHQVSGCNGNCPFLRCTSTGVFYCSHLSLNVESDIISYYNLGTAPEWCPLKSESITISFKTKENNESK